MKNTLKQVIFDQQKASVNMLIERMTPQHLVTCNEILVISGIRRCGKSTLLQQIRSKQKHKDYYLNFDDERLLNFTVEHFQALHELFIELFGVQTTFYFDEIQNVVGWERFVRRLYDSGYKVFVTGSNAGMLSKELGTHLTGRFCQYELYPFSFAEYLQFKKNNVTEKDFYTTVGKVSIIKAFKQYMQEGGFPQYLTNNNADYLKSLYESILYRDVLVRNKLTNEHELLELVYYLASNVSVLSSYNSLTKVIGIKNASTIKSYIDHLENTYLLFQINKYDYSLKKQIQNPKKTYFIDNALVKRLGFSHSDNTGRLLENLVFIELKRRGYEVFYHSDKHECDFVIRENGIINKAIQVCHSIENEDTKQREIVGLYDAMEKYNLSEGLIITSEFEEEMMYKTKNVKFVPVWKLLLK